MSRPIREYLQKLISPKLDDDRMKISQTFCCLWGIIYVNVLWLSCRSVVRGKTWLVMVTSCVSVFCLSCLEAVGMYIL